MHVLAHKLPRDVAAALPEAASRLTAGAVAVVLNPAEGPARGYVESIAAALADNLVPLAAEAPQDTADGLPAAVRVYVHWFGALRRVWDEGDVRLAAAGHGGGAACMIRTSPPVLFADDAEPRLQHCLRALAEGLVTAARLFQPAVRRPHDGDDGDDGDDEGGEWVGLPTAIVSLKWHGAPVSEPDRSVCFREYMTVAALLAAVGGPAALVTALRAAGAVDFGVAEAIAHLEERAEEVDAPTLRALRLEVAYHCRPPAADKPWAPLNRNGEDLVRHCSVLCAAREPAATREDVAACAGAFLGPAEGRGGGWWTTRFLRAACLLTSDVLVTPAEGWRRLTAVTDGLRVACAASAKRLRGWAALTVEQAATLQAVEAEEGELEGDAAGSEDAAVAAALRWAADECARKEAQATKDRGKRAAAAGKRQRAAERAAKSRAAKRKREDRDAGDADSLGSFVVDSDAEGGGSGEESG